jgi:hypothetical protein
MFIDCLLLSVIALPYKFAHSPSHLASRERLANRVANLYQDTAG